MAKALTIMSIVTAILLLALFGLDLAVKFPFRRASPGLDVIFVLAALGLAYLSWNAFRDIR